MEKQSTITALSMFGIIYEYDLLNRFRTEKYIDEITITLNEHFQLAYSELDLH